MDFKATETEVKKHWEDIDLPKLRKEKRAKGKKFFYLDGPPYVNVKPHAGNFFTRILRDSYLKFKQLQGYNVWLKPGFDTHGLPVEVVVEKQLKLGTKKQIHEFGVANFVEECRKHALAYKELWIDFYKDIGHNEWDLDDPYITMRNEYISSTWRFFKAAEEKKLLYKGKKTVPFCPRCETALSSHEVAQEYQQDTDYSIYVKFPVKNKEKEFFLVWTTTPWTLVSNLAITINKDFDYALLDYKGEKLWIAKDTLERLVDNKVFDEKPNILEEKKGKELLDLQYTNPLEEKIPYHKTIKHIVVHDDYVSLEEGTGLVHTAPGHGEEDYETGLKYNLPIFSPVSDSGHFTEEAGDFSGKLIFDANREILDFLKEKNVLLREETYIHSYPHCWRCRTKLFYKASTEWFVKMTALKNRLIEENKKILWQPKWAGEKRFGDWLKNIRDWSISRKRFWGIPLPIWECEKCDKRIVFGSKQELEKVYGKEIKDLHKPYIDEVKLKCECGGEMKRVEEIADIWFDSGAAPWASLAHYENSEELFNELFPVDFITEGSDQTRGWFYSLLAESVLLFDKASYKKVQVNGLVLDEKGEKMSKSKGNAIDPLELLQKYPADSLRWYLLAVSPPWNDFSIIERDFSLYTKGLNTYYNLFTFVQKYFELYNFSPKENLDKLANKLEIEDKWILSRFTNLKEETEKGFENMENHVPARALYDFILNNLSRDYIKFVRERIKEGNKREQVFEVLHFVLNELPKFSTPVIPFLSEKIYQSYKFRKKKEKSVVLEEWPDFSFRDEKLEEKMKKVLEVIEKALAIRDREKIPVRQALKTLKTNSDIEEGEHIVKRVVNVKNIKYFKKEGNIEVELDLRIDKELLSEGITREFTRRIQDMRKSLGLIETDLIEVSILGDKETLGLIDKKTLEKNTNTKRLYLDKEIKPDLEKTHKIKDKDFRILIKKA